MKYLLIVAILVILSGIHCVKAFADVSYADMFLSGKGYKPVEEAWSVKSSISSLSGENILCDNQLYREWCIHTFYNGEQIYEAYKEIAFDIDYRAEPPKTDFWQTPIETIQKKQGDCEDSVFLFFSKLFELDIDGDIVWGWVVDKSKSIAFAHVWYQLFDKHGRPYIVEGFSKEWNGIVPIELIAETEERVPTLALKHNQVSRVADKMGLIIDHNLGPASQEFFEDTQFLWNIYLNNTTIIKEIFQKLQEMFGRYKEQTYQISHP